MTINNIGEVAIAGSFRDPAGRVFKAEGQVFRAVFAAGEERFRALTKKNFYEQARAAGYYIGHEVSPRQHFAEYDGIKAVVCHPKVPFISYPYEWTFSQLRDAAIYHIDVHLFALEKNVVLTDATAYNIQFIGPKPIFIDMFSFRDYVEGEYWVGHRQFIEQFIAPLLMNSCLGIPHNHWFRGSLEGVSMESITKMLPLRHKIDWRIFWNIVLPELFRKRVQLKGTGANEVQRPLQRPLPKVLYARMLRGLRSWAEKLGPVSGSKSVWQDYAGANSYDDDAKQKKSAFVKSFCEATGVETVWDFGCNSGDYAVAALAGGAKNIVGFDADFGALQAAYHRAKTNNLPFLPLYMDAANPSPQLGWNEQERIGLSKRDAPGAIIALAFVHHLAIGRNIPLKEVVSWLCSKAPCGVIEFVPKSDPTVQQMLRFREDIFIDYRIETMKSAISVNAQIVKSEVVTSTGRTLIWYSRS